jgi:hypothetical protein
MPPSVLADALFASYLQPSDLPTAVRVHEAIRLSLRVHGAGCAAAVAAEHPDTAVARMRWALALATAVAATTGGSDQGDVTDVAARAMRPELAAA